MPGRRGVLPGERFALAEPRERLGTTGESGTERALPDFGFASNRSVYLDVTRTCRRAKLTSGQRSATRSPRRKAGEGGGQVNRGVLVWKRWRARAP
jgi:hypothetical protein